MNNNCLAHMQRDKQSWYRFQMKTAPQLLYHTVQAQGMYVNSKAYRDMF